MKLCLLSNQTRSMAIFWRVLIKTLISNGFDVLCAAPAGDSRSEEDLMALGARVRNYPLDRKGLNPVADISSFMALKSLFRQEKPDILFATTIKPVIYGCAAAAMAGVPGIYATITGLGYAFEADTLPKKILNIGTVALYRHSLAHASGVFFQNRDDEALFREKGILGANANIFLTAGTGVDIQRFAPKPFPPLPPEGPMVFLLIGRLLAAKGLEEFTIAAGLLKKRYPDARFQILGPPEHGPGCVEVEQLQRWANAGDVEYLGECRDVRPHIAASHVVVLPSWREGVPTSLMEAMSMGRPCVATDVPGCREVVENGKNGWLAKVRDPQSLAVAMDRFLADPASISIMGEYSRQLAVDKFDAEKVADGIIRDMRSVYPEPQNWAPTGV